MVDSLWRNRRRSARNPARNADQACAKGRHWLQATVLAVALACASAIAPAHAAPESTEIYVISNGWHTEIGLPADWLEGSLSRFRQGFPGASYFVFGWGERAFYMSPAPTWTEALRALLPARAVLLVLALETVPTEAFERGVQVTPVPIEATGARRLAAFIWRSFAQSAAGAPERLASGPYPASAFYAATGTYDGGHTCNTWTAEALDQAGLPVRAVGVVFAGQVMRQVRALSAGPLLAVRQK